MAYSVLLQSKHVALALYSIIVVLAAIYSNQVNV